MAEASNAGCPASVSLSFKDKKLCNRVFGLPWIIRFSLSAHEQKKEEDVPKYIFFFFVCLL